MIAFGAQAIQYTRQAPNGQLDPGIAANSDVAGVYVNFGWSSIETADGTYAWSQVDNAVNAVIAGGKKVVIGITAGVATPSWVYAEGAKSFGVVWDRGWGYTPCTNLLIPIPWDSTFQAKWAAFVSAFGARYDTNPNVVAVKLEGFNSFTSEIALPLTVNEKININGHSCTGPNYPKKWQNVGYTRTLAEAAWNDIAADFASAFPNTPWEAMMEPATFPPIDQNGNLLSSPEDNQAVTDVVSGAITNYGDQFVLANDGLSASWVWKTEESYASQIPTGYQMLNSPMGSQLAGAVNLGLTANPAYLEISDPDIDNPNQASTIAFAAASLP